jgi:hypothetical protein
VVKPNEEQLIEANRSVEPYVVRLAMDLGYVIKEWGFVDYLRAAIFGNPSDSVKRVGFENVVVWGKQGTGKSNLALQLAYAIYQDWDVALKRLILTPQEVVQLYRETRREGKRIPLVVLDDITTIFPKQLWFVNRELFTLLQQFIATVRERFSVIISTTPLIQNLVSSLADNITFEVAVFPAGSYLVERYAWLPEPEKPISSLHKIVVEYALFNLGDVPSDVWDEYEERRWQITDTIVEKIESKLDSSNRTNISKEILSKILPTETEVIEKFRGSGYKIEQNKAALLISFHRKLIEEKVAALAKNSSVLSS